MFIPYVNKSLFYTICPQFVLQFITRPIKSSTTLAVRPSFIRAQLNVSHILDSQSCNQFNKTPGLRKIRHYWMGKPHFSKRRETSIARQRNSIRAMCASHQFFLRAKPFRAAYQSGPTAPPGRRSNNNVLKTFVTLGTNICRYTRYIDATAGRDDGDDNSDAELRDQSATM